MYYSAAEAVNRDIILYEALYEPRGVGRRLNWFTLLQAFFAQNTIPL